MIGENHKSTLMPEIIFTNCQIFSKIKNFQKIKRTFRIDINSERCILMTQIGF